jgi:hypothetical protein
MKIPLAFSLKNRDDTTDKDARVLNGYVEIRKNRKGKVESLRTYKRPALDSAFELTAGTGQALYVPSVPDGGSFVDGEPGVIIGDILTRAPTPKTKKLAFGTQPTTANLNSAITVTVRILNSIGNLVNSTANVSIALSTNPTGATLGGTTTVAAVAGVATFNDLTLNRSGEDFVFEASSSGLTSVRSNAFSLPTQFAFTTQPVGTGPGDMMADIVVAAQDSLGTTDTQYTADVRLQIYTATGSGLLSGFTERLATNGVATFGGLSIDQDGTYTLIATGKADNANAAYTPANKVSDSFQIAEYSLTAGTDGSFEFGFNTTYGSISPTAYNGATIVALFSHTAITETNITLDGTLAQNYFTSMTFNGVTLNSADATTFQQIGGQTTWIWSSVMFSATGTFPGSIS